MEYICNKANHPKCFKCGHSYPHEKSRLSPHCTEYGDCFGSDGVLMFRVRCVSIESKTGKKVVSDLNKTEVQDKGIDKIMISIKQIEEDHPLSLEHETDSRHIWPKRWESLKKYIEKVMEE